jgi:hypothetical protein
MKTKTKALSFAAAGQRMGFKRNAQKDLGKKKIQGGMAYED